MSGVGGGEVSSDGAGAQSFFFACLKGGVVERLEGDGRKLVGLLSRRLLAPHEEGQNVYEYGESFVLRIRQHVQVVCRPGG